MTRVRFWFLILASYRNPQWKRNGNRLNHLHDHLPRALSLPVWSDNKKLRFGKTYLKTTNYIQIIALVAHRYNTYEWVAYFGGKKIKSSFYINKDFFFFFHLSTTLSCIYLFINIKSKNTYNAYMAISKICIHIKKKKRQRSYIRTRTRDGRT